MTGKSAILCAALLLFPLTAQAKSNDPLLNGFLKPPQAAKPRVWWHWMNGNVTPRGIRRDLDWMNRVGIGGVTAIDASIDTPQVVKKRLIYMTPEWKRAFRQAAALADKNGMELSIDSSPGWSETGGPWVAPQAAMKKLVWSRTALEGGAAFHGVLPLPPSVPGPFQNIPNGATNAPSFYRDAVVLAYRAPAEPAPAEAVSNGGATAAPSLGDGDLTNGAVLKPPSPGQDVWIRMDYRRPVRMQGVTLALSLPDGLGFAARIEASDDGRDWRAVAGVPPAAQVRRFALLQQTIAFTPTVARYFRLVLRPDAPIPTSLRIVERAPGLADAPAPKPRGEDARIYRLRELVFHAGATVNEFEKKAGFAIARDNYAIATQGNAPPDTVIPRGDVVPLSDHMAADGTLDWTPPPGHWTVLRMGYSLTGSQNHPATKEATGLEVDKLSRAHVRDYMERYLDTYVDAAGPGLFARHGLTSLTVDSTEVGAQNWTETMLADFRRLRGYDPAPWLPTLTGVVVASAADSDKFLWDFRRTIAELTAQNHYGEIARIAAERGLLDYAEALEDHRPTFGDDIDMRRFARVPMGAMWAYDAAPRATYVADLLGAASVAHVYGRELVAAESLTSAGQPWAYAPRMLKPMLDLEFVLGVNRVFLHTSVHQPVERAPGLSLGGYGQFFNRLDAWADMAGGWMSYIARCSWLLRQGRHAADIAYFTGQEAPITGLFGDAAVDVPAGHGFDFVGSDAVLRLLSVDHGELVTPSGMRYRILYLGGSSRFMTLPVLRRVRDLAMQGAVVVGAKPLASPSLADDAAQFRALADEVFGNTDADHALGQGRVFASGSLPAALAALNLAPDFEYTKPQADTELLSLHRHLADGELYFVSNRRGRAENVAATFRVAGRDAEIWDAVTGRRIRVAVAEKEGRSTVDLALPAYGSAFVVFRPSGAAIASASAVPPQTLTGPWTIAFQPGRGAPIRPMRIALGSWSGNADPGIRYFSGTATYRTTFDLAKLSGRLVLDLGTAREVAEVTLNGKRLGTAWTAPFALDITGAARPGRNRLTVRVSNLWVNRLIGDAQPGAGREYTFTTIPTYRADAPLRESGLIGPVTIRRER